MIHVNSITAALTALLSSDTVLVDSGFTIEAGEALNDDLHHTPWVGVYYGTLGIDPHTVGGAAPWRGQLELLLYVQDGSHRGGQEATRRLTAAQAAVLDVLDANRTLGGTVQALTGMDISPFRRDLRDDTWLFTNEIAVRADVRG